jgi:lambda family phage minor tail protein L
MATINQEGNKLNPDAYIELYTFDASLIGGATYYFSNTPGLNAPVIWRGNSYYPFPFEVTGYETKSDGTAPNKPTLSISNVNQFFMQSILTLGNLTGMKVTRYRTFYKFTDTGTEPNINAHYPVEEYIITKKLPSSPKTIIQFEMSNVLDRQGLKLPRRQILRDLGFPAAARARMR